MSIYDIEKKKWNEKAQQILRQQQKWENKEKYCEIFTKRNILRPTYYHFDKIGLPETKVLDYGCGDGWTAALLADASESVRAFDISGGRVEIVKKIIKENGITNLDVSVANGEELPYKDEEFDYVFGNAILHHIPLEKCLPEIARVLKPGGRAAFGEPLAHNPVINFLRYIHHNYMEKYIGTDKPLKDTDITDFEKYFSKVEFNYSSFLLDKNPLFIALDRLLLKIPFLRRYTTYVTVLLEK